MNIVDTERHAIANKFNIIKAIAEPIVELENNKEYDHDTKINPIIVATIQPIILFVGEIPSK